MNSDTVNEASVSMPPRVRFRLSYLCELCALLVVVALCERELLGVVGKPLEPDSYSYRRIAEGMSHLFDTSFREPVWIWFVWAFGKVWGPVDFSLRMGGMYLFLCTTVLVYALTYITTSSRFASVVAGLAFGCNPFLHYLALSGNRDNMVMLSMTGLTVVSLSPRFPSSRKLRIVAVTLFTVLALGSRISNAPGAAFLLGYSVLRRYLRLRDLIWPIGCVAMILGPYFVYCNAQFGDPLHASNIHSRWFRNYEFCYVKKTGCDGCSCQTYFNEAGQVVEPFGGAPITTFQYVFGLHSTEEVLRLTKLGISTILFSEGAYFEQLSGFHYDVIWPVYLLGLGALILSHRRVVLLVPLVCVNFVFFTVNMMPGRIFTLLSPFLALAIAVGCAVAVSLTLTLLSFIIPNAASLRPLDRSAFTDS